MATSHQQQLHVPAGNSPGHHPDHEQDKPMERFAARAEELTRRAHEAEAERRDHAAADDASGSEASSSDASDGEAPDEERPAATTGRQPAVATAVGEVEGLLAVPSTRMPDAVPAPAGSAAAAAGGQPGLPLPLQVVVPAVGIIDALRRPATAWRTIGESRTGWVVRIGLVPVLGPWRYATEVRPRLDAAARASALTGA